MGAPVKIVKSETRPAPKPETAKPDAPKPDMAKPSALQILLALEGEAMGCSDRLALKHVAVNKPRALVETGHIFLLTRSGHKFKFEAISSQAVVEKNAPLVQWISRQLSHLSRAHDLSKPLPFGLDPKADGGFDYPFLNGFYAPFAPDPARGGLLFTRERKWEEKDLHIPTRLAQIYGLQWTALGTKKRSRLSGKKKLWLSGAAILSALILCIPVPVTSLAPAEIVASAPFIVTAPMDGVIKALHVAPG
ncbi:MAG: hypothetical protein V3U82_09060, partial [Robiginitomaculum sp.]